MKPPQKPATPAIALPTARKLREIAHASSNALERLPAGQFRYTNLTLVRNVPGSRTRPTAFRVSVFAAQAFAIVCAALRQLAACAGRCFSG
jgi:hypothetical protein